MMVDEKNLLPIAQAALNAATKKAEELGEDRLIGAALGILAAAEGLETFAKLVEILGFENAMELGDLMMKRETEKAIKEAEDAIRDEGD